MFKDNEAFSGFSVDDIDAAKEFYGEKLGLDVTENEMGFLNLTLGTGARVLVYGKPDHQPATYTILNFMVTDIERAVDDLASAGIQMETYGVPEMKQDAKGISRAEQGPAIAWFKDPAGNTIGVIERQGHD